MGSKGDILVRGKFKRNFKQEPMEAMKVVVHNNDITKALRTLKKKMQNEGIFNELRERTGFKSRGERRRLEKAAGRRRYLKKQQKLKDSRGY
jgi:small subunit ribosomal protein S21